MGNFWTSQQKTVFDLSNFRIFNKISKKTFYAKKVMIKNMYLSVYYAKFQFLKINKYNFETRHHSKYNIS